MRPLILLLTAFLWAQSGQRVKLIFGLYEGDANTGSSIYFRQQLSDGSVIIIASPLIVAGAGRFLEPYGNDLAYDPITKTLFIAGGGPNFNVNWGVIYGIREPWRNLTFALDSLTPQIGARRLAIKDTLLLATRNRPPFFTAYRIQPTATGVALDSLWSPPAHPNLRSSGEGIVVVGDSAFITQSYDPNTFGPDSFIVLINLQTRQVVAAYEVEDNPNDLLRIGNALYAACYTDFMSPLQIARLDLSTGTVTSLATGLNSFSGFTADTGGRDTILFWSTSGALSAFAVQTQNIESPYRGIMALSGLTGYALLRVGGELFMSFTDFTDTCVVVRRDLQGSAFSDTLGIATPSLRRFLYAEEDESVVTGIRGLSQGSGISLYPNPVTTAFHITAPAPRSVHLYDLQGRLLRDWRPAPAYEVADLPAGLYLVIIENEQGERQTLRLQKL